MQLYLCYLHLLIILQDNWYFFYQEDNEDRFTERKVWQLDNGPFSCCLCNILSPQFWEAQKWEGEDNVIDKF